MYDWKQGEPITAAKLNKTGQQLYMNTIDTTAPGGGLLTDICSCYWCDPGSTITFTEVQQAAHALGNVTLEYDDTCDEWTPRGGAPGVTGYKEFGGGVIQWLTAAQKDGNVWQVWQRVNTSSDGTPTASSIIVSRTAPGSSVLWGVSTPGSIYRHLANVQWEASMRRWNITNQNKALILPVARHFGWINTSQLEVNDDQDVQNRNGNAHVVPIAKLDTVGNTVPILGAMEVGGVIISEVTCSCTPIGLGLSAGVEFYDDCTLCSSFNACDPRPQARTANVDLFGKTLTIKPAGGHDCRPWQFLVTHDCGRFDPTGDGDWGSDPGSRMFAHDETAQGITPRRTGLIRGITSYSCCSMPWIDNDGIIHVYSPS